MDAKTFSKKLKEIKAEVLALKQAHEIGLNRTNFDFRWLGYPISSRNVQFRMTIVISGKTSGEPYIDISVEDIFITGKTWTQNTQTMIIVGQYFYPFQSSNYSADFGIISTKPIKSVLWEEINA